MALVFILALLIDSACAAACIPAELKGATEHCNGGDHGSESPERGCDLHQHLMPVVREQGATAVSTGHPWVSLESPETAMGVDPGGFDATAGLDDILGIPPPVQRNPVLRI